MAILLKNQGNEPIPTQYQHMGKIFLLRPYSNAIHWPSKSLYPPSRAPRATLGARGITAALRLPNNI